MVLPFLKLDTSSVLNRHFAIHQIYWIEAEDPLHAQNKQVCALAEKSVRIGWTYCDSFKNVRKRLRFKKRDYLFVTKDHPSALEYVTLAWDFVELFDLTRAIISRGEEYVKIPRVDDRGRSTGFTEEVKVGVIKFDTGSRIIAFSSSPQAMAVYGGDVGLDEFAKHPNARLLWETAQGRVALGHDIAVWSSHDGEDTLFNQFAQQARACSRRGDEADSLSALGRGLGEVGSSSSSFSNSCSSSFLHEAHDSDRAASSSIIPPPTSDLSATVSTQNPASSIQDQSLCAINPEIHQSNNPRNTNSSPWNLYFRVTMPDAIEHGFLDIINRARGTKLEPEQFLADCRSRAGLPEIYEQSYLCNPVSPAAAIVDWSAIERCRHDYQIERLHLDHDTIQEQFGSAKPEYQHTREHQISAYLHSHFPILFTSRESFSASSSSSSSLNSHPSTINPRLRLGFDIAASGHGNLACIYIDSVNNGPPLPSDGRGAGGEGSGSGSAHLWLTALFTCRTDDWHFLKTVLFTFLRDIPNIRGAGDESGLGRQICWEAATQFGDNKFLKINFASKKSDLGFRLMNQLASAEKRFPKSHDDISADFFALRKHYTGTRWNFTEGRNPYNTASHCDIAWAGALASEAHAQKRSVAWAMVG